MATTRFAMAVVAQETSYLSEEELLEIAGTVIEFGPMFRCREGPNETNRNYDVVGYAEVGSTGSDDYTALDLREFSEEWNCVCRKLKEDLESLGPEPANPAICQAAFYLLAKNRPHEAFIRLVFSAKESITPYNTFRIRCVSATIVAVDKVRLVKKKPKATPAN